MQNVALITGASGGIGSAIARTFAKNGYAVALHYYKGRDAVQMLASELPEGTAYALLPCDLNSAAETEAMIRSLHLRLGKVGVLVNCAGTALSQTLFSETTDADAEAVFGLDVLAPMRLTRLLIDDLRETKGTVVNISSMWGISGASCEVVYSAAKAALNGFTKALAKELGPEGITVNAIAPGLIPTQMNAHLSEDDMEAFRMETPLERLGSPEDVAEAALYLAGARFVTGQILSVDGGIVI